MQDALIEDLGIHYENGLLIIIFFQLFTHRYFFLILVFLYLLKGFAFYFNLELRIFLLQPLEC